MTDKFLQKILDATAKMRAEGTKRKFSELGTKIYNCIYEYDARIWPLTDKIAEIIGDDWYGVTEKPELIPFSLFINDNDSCNGMLLIKIYQSDNCNFLFSTKSVGRYLMEHERPATDKEIHTWYEEFLK